MAREALLLHAGEETIHPEKEPAPKTPKGKWENFWYYHKWHLLILAVAAIVAGYLIHDTLSVQRPDYQIGMITEYAYPQTDLDALQARFAAAGKDLNGDGRVVVQIDDYFFPADGGDGTQADMANRMKFEADLSTGQSVIFLTDEASFSAEQRALSMFSLTGGGAPKPENGMADMRVPLKSCPKLSDLKDEEQVTSGGEKGDLFANLGISLRVNSDNVKPEDYAASKALFDAIISK